MTLKAALQLKEKEMVSLIGAGGKTTTLFRLARELHEEGGKILLSTTTKIFKPTKPHVHKLYLAQNLDALLNEMAKITEPAIIGAGYGVDEGGKLVGLPHKWLDALHQKGGFTSILVEADGAASHFFKVPSDHEPVVPQGSTLTIWVMAVKVLGRPLEPTWVHRAERAASLLGIALGTPMALEHIHRLVEHPSGCLKGIPEKSRKVAIINQADTPEEVDKAASLGQGLIRGGIERVLITSYLHGDAVRQVISGQSEHLPR